MFHMFTCNLSERFPDESKYFIYQFLISASFLFSPLVPIKSLVCCVKSGFFATFSHMLRLYKFKEALLLWQKKCQQRKRWSGRQLHTQKKTFTHNSIMAKLTAPVIAIHDWGRAEPSMLKICSLLCITRLQEWSNVTLSCF